MDPAILARISSRILKFLGAQASSLRLRPIRADMTRTA